MDAAFRTSALWPNVRNSDEIKNLFPRSLNALDEFTLKALREIEDSFLNVIRIPFALKNCNNTFYAIDFTRALGQCRSQVLQVVALTHEICEVRQKALDCLHRIQSVLIKYKSDKELYQACICARSGSGHPADKIPMMEEMLHEFEREGAHLNREEWLRCIDLKNEIKRMESLFLKNIDDDETVIWILFSELKGIPAKFLDAFERRGDMCRVPCDTNTYYGVICFCDIEKTRKRMFLAYNRRGFKKNLPLIQELIKKRNELATLLNYKSYAHFDISNQLAKTPEGVNLFLSKIEETAKLYADKEIDKLIARVPDNYFASNQKNLPWNMAFLFALGRGSVCLEDDEEMRQYFAIDTTFPKILDYLSVILKLNFTIKHDPVWAGVIFRVEVKDEHDNLLGNILYDLYPRRGKYGHAICHDVIPPLLIEGKRTAALAVIIVNISPPDLRACTLLTLDEISTLLHETGHALHELLGACETPTKAGYRTTTDFLELPPILLENLIYERSFLSAISHHYQSGDQIYEEILRNRAISKKFGVSYTLQQQAMLSKLSLHFHLPGGDKTTQVREQIYQDSNPEIAQIENFHYEVTFRHLGDPLYGSKYYGFLYALAFSTEVYKQIQRSPDEWFRFRKIVLEKGGSGNPLSHLALFLGKTPSIQPFLDEIKPL